MIAERLSIDRDRPHAAAAAAAPDPDNARAALVAAHKLLTRLIASGASQAEAVDAQAVSVQADLRVIVTIGPAAGPLPRAGDREDVIGRDLPAHWRSLTETEVTILRAMPLRQPRPLAEIAQATGYSVRYASDLLAELFRDGLVFKGCGGSWVRV